MPLIRVTRSLAFVDRLIAYGIRIDGHRRARIREGETKEILIEEGTHRLMLRAPMEQSEEWSFELRDEEVTSFLCAPNYDPPVPPSNWSEVPDACSKLFDLLLQRRGPWIYVEMQGIDEKDGTQGHDLTCSS